MAALDRLDELERFLLSLRPEETFRPHRLWQLPLLGLFDYALPRTVEEKLGDPVALARDLAASEIEVVVLATDLSDEHENGDSETYELPYSSKRTPPEVMAQAVLASAAISALVLPLRVEDRIATDGGWVRNFPLGYAYDRPEIELIVAFRYLPKYPRLGAAGLGTLRRRLERFGRVPPIRAFISELEEAEARAERGEPAHLAEMIVRLTRVAIMRNTLLEERVADDKDESIRELAALREDISALIGETVGRRRDRERLEQAVADRFAAARFPFRHDRLIPRVTVRGSIAEVNLEPGFRNQKPWTEDAKLDLIARGYELTDDELTAAGIEFVMEPTDRPWALRTANFHDPDGHVWEIAHKIPGMAPPGRRDAPNPSR
jgi:predicted acylesterase/phospholipase RssA